MPPTCVLCSSTADVAFEKNGIPIYRCNACEHAFALPESSIEHVDAVYGDEAKVRDGRTLKWISLRHAISLASYVIGERSSESLEARISPSLAVPYPSEDLFWGIYRKDG